MAEGKTIIGATARGYRIRRLRPEEIATAVEWARSEGWNPGRFDADSFYAADPDGFFAGECDGRLVATISLVRYGATFAFLGFYIVHPDYRGRGFGLAIWREAMRFAGGRTVGLDGVLAQQDNYRKSGFVFQYSHIRCCGIAGATAPAAPLPAPGIVAATEIPRDELADWDAFRFGADRRTFLAHWLTQSGSIALATRDRDGHITGYGVIRPAAVGHRIGPLFAADIETAEVLFSELVRRIPPGATYFIDMPETNPAAIALCRRHRLEPGFKTARMYVHGVRNLPLNEIYGATTLELG